MRLQRTTDSDCSLRGYCEGRRQRWGGSNGIAGDTAVLSVTQVIYIFLPLVSNYLSDSLTHEQNVEKFESYITCVQRLSVHRGDITAHRIN